MPRLVGEAYHLVFDRRTIARPATTYLPAVHRRAVQVGANQIVDGIIRVSDVAWKLVKCEPIGKVRKWLGLIITRLQLNTLVVDRASVQPRRRAGFKTGELET